MLVGFHPEDHLLVDYGAPGNGVLNIPDRGEGVDPAVLIGNRSQRGRIHPHSVTRLPAEQMTGLCGLLPDQIGATSDVLFASTDPCACGATTDFFSKKKQKQDRSLCVRGDPF